MISATTLTVIGIVFAVITVLLCIANYFFNKYYVLPEDETDARRNQHFLAFMPGLRREDIEEFHLDAEQWECSVCEFHNLTTKPHCLLCGTRQACRFVAPQTTAPSKLSLSRTSSGNYIQLHSTRASLKSTTSRYSMIAFENFLLPDDLNAQQRNARMRKQWIRQKDSQGRIKWHRRFINSTAIPDAFVVQLISPQVKIGSLSPLPESPRTTQASSLESCSQSPSVQSAWTPLAAVPPNYTVVGTSILPETAASLFEISKLSFPLKYAWFLHQLNDLVVPYDELHLRVKVWRCRVMEEAVENLLSYPDRALCAIVRYEFINESAQDAGAVQREWYTLTTEEMLHEDSGLFLIMNREDQSYFINQNSAYKWRHFAGIDHIEAFRAVGRFIGRTLLDGQVVPMHLSPVILKAILGIPLTFDDVESMDPTVYKSLMYILDHDSVKDLALTFSVTEQRGDKVVELPLVANGHLRSVTDSNKHEYVSRMVEYLLFGRVEDQMTALVQGVYEVVPPELLMALDHKEFELILCGLTDIDVADWQANTVVSSNLEESKTLEWFWEIVSEMSHNDRSKLLQFATGSSRVPVQGFKGLTSYDGEICHFTLKGIPYTCGVYPAAHACYNRIDLPLYPTRDMMHEALSTLVMSDPTGFTIV
ncbi:unnamed protein product [Aphanomyces euteiches]|uniref:HECT-type E3 ubiquitin transferase n=1 Tax=Aphanomyces euteiches TaxID=100861 RepID=A0A6G0XAJ8_9STRA|nr:hypothetical protein Ae201684_006811 [Aphanomyces euteiches]KAH9138948.1 hypothetical protein AeRB84_016774 [Aphanomyces euteiches]